MKKLISTLTLALLISYTALAGSLTIFNGTSATFTFQIQTYTALGVPSCVGDLIVPPGMTILNSPLDVPSLAGCSQATDNFAQLWGFCNPYDLHVDNLAVFPNGYGFQSVGPDPNDCTGSPFILSWNSNTSTLVIN